MQRTSVEISVHSGPVVSGASFRILRSGIAYDDMHDIRIKASEFFESRGFRPAHAGNLLLALTEVLSNLIKHPPEKARQVEIGISVSGTLAEVEVLDDSTPFANFDAKCESAPARLHIADNTSGAGYGLGLIISVSKTRAYAAGDQARGALNRFSFSCDLAASLAPAAEMKRKIFLIDDDPISLQIHRSMLEDAYEVTVFERASAALEAFSSTRPDLVISDLLMPEMDGAALRQALGRVEGGDDTPFIFLSGHSDSEHNPYISQLGVDDFLCKPVTQARLKTVISRLLRRSEQVRATVQGQFHHDITELLKPALPPRYGDWKFTVVNAVAESGGGDFILHADTPSVMTAVIADVMGHGRQAKFFSYVYAGYLRSMFRLYQGTLDASRFLRNLSQYVDGDPVLESMMMTCQCFQFFHEGILKVASAGHPPPLIFSNGAISAIDAAGPVLGLAGDSPYDMKSLRLRPGDRAVFMTDGFLDVFDRKGRGTEALLQSLRDAADMPSPQLSRRLWENFLERREKSSLARDDATIIVAEYGAKS